MTARPVALALALVESPAQLLNLLEWALGERDGAPEPVRCEAAVLLPLDPATRHQLGVMADVARAEGIDVGLYDIRKVPVGFAHALASLVRKLTTADRLVIGDPFSGIIQRLLPLARTRDFVLLDDGTAALELSPSRSRAVRWSAGTTRDPRRGRPPAPLAA